MRAEVCSRARFLLRLASASAALTLAGADDLNSRVTDALNRYLKAIPAVGTLTGQGQLYDYAERLNDDLQALSVPQPPGGYSLDEFRAMYRNVAVADVDLANQLVLHKITPFKPAAGMQPFFLRSSADDTFQPVAVYAPAAIRLPAPLVFMLHGHGETETELLANPLLQQLAESTKSYVVAPFGRGIYDFEGIARSDVDDAIGAATSRLAVDRRRCYLAGYSMGAFAAFEIAMSRHDLWSAVLCISGALLGHEARAVSGTLGRTRFYVVTGADDTVVPSSYPVASAKYLASQDVPVSLYVEPNGTHDLVTLAASLTQAWNDMHAGVVRDAAV